MEVLVVIFMEVGSDARGERGDWDGHSKGSEGFFFFRRKGEKV